MYVESEFLQNTEVKAEWAEVVGGATQPLAERYELEYEQWYHDMPIWLVGDIQLRLTRSQGENILEIHKGSANHLAFQIEKLGQEALSSVVETLITST